MTLFKCLALNTINSPFAVVRTLKCLQQKDAE